MIVPYNLSPKFQERVRYVSALRLKDGRLEAARQHVVRQIKTPTNATKVMTLSHQLQRFELLGTLNLLDNKMAADAIVDPRYKLWDEYSSIPASDEQKETLSQLMYSGLKPASALIQAYDYTAGVSEKILTKCAQDDKGVDVWIDDKVFERRILNSLDEEGAVRHAKYWADRYEGTDRRILLMSTTSSHPFLDAVASKDVAKIAQDGFLSMRAKGRWASQGMTLTKLPTPQDAVMEDMAHQELVQILFNMCAIDLTKVEQAQEYYKHQLDAASVIHITNSDGTNVTCKKRGFTYANSLMDANVPGTETWSASERDGIDGRIVSPGKFLPYTDDRVVENITLEVRKGRIVDYKADAGFEHLKDFIETEEDTHYFGEGPAFGGNRALSRHVANTLLVEKIAGSVHFAIGKTLNHKTAKVNNGNGSGKHWDITTMLHNKDGMIALDGVPIMKHGRYLPKEMAYLNPA